MWPTWLKAATLVVFAAVMICVVKPLSRMIAEGYGLVGTMLALAAIFAVGAFIDWSDKRAARSRGQKTGQE